MACMVTGHHGPGLFLLERLCVYRNHPHTVQELKHAMWDEIKTINHQLIC